MAASTVRPIALITGANKGLGLYLSTTLASQHGYHVIVASRNLEAGEKVAAGLRADGHAASSVQLDLTSEPSIKAAVKTVERDFGHLDVLINNAGIFWDPAPWIDRPERDPYDLFHGTFMTNVIGPAALTSLLLPLLRKAQAKPPRVVFLTSSLASLTRSANGFRTPASGPAYNASKSAVNMLAIMFSQALEDVGGKVNAACPGFMATDMTEFVQGGTTPEVGAVSALRFALLGEDGPTAHFEDKDGPIEW